MEDIEVDHFALEDHPTPRQATSKVSTHMSQKTVQFPDGGQYEEAPREVQEWTRAAHMAQKARAQQQRDQQYGMQGAKVGPWGHHRSVGHMVPEVQVHNNK
ncbi:MAG: hypothetical protein Q9170_007279 [Blastenia crenularia]